MKAECNLEAESLHVDGSLFCAKQICADKIEICGSVQADEIVGDHIKIELDPRPRAVRQIKKMLNSLLNRPEQERGSCANLIEATTIELYNVTAGVVSGENVTIGENCRIDRLEYTGSCTLSPTSTVRILNGQPYNG